MLRMGAKQNDTSDVVSKRLGGHGQVSDEEKDNAIADYDAVEEPKIGKRRSLLLRNDIYVNSMREKQQYIQLIKLLKGYQHFDSICTELQMPRRDIEQMLDRLGNYSVINS